MMQQSIRVVSQSTTEPITLAEAKAHLRVDFDDDDDYIMGLISAARDFAEGFQHKSILDYTYEVTQDQFSYPIYLQKLPVKSVANITFTRFDGTVGTVDPTSYIVTVDGKIVPKLYWPADYLQFADAVKITYTAGQGGIPDPTTKQAMLILIGHWYEYREVVVASSRQLNEIPFGVRSLLWMGKNR